MPKLLDTALLRNDWLMVIKFGEILENSILNFGEIEESRVLNFREIG